MSAPAIQLLSQRPPLSIPDERVYFSFASGRFTYDCVHNVFLVDFVHVGPQLTMH